MSDNLKRLFQGITGKPVTFRDEVDNYQLQTIRYWAEALATIKGYPALWSLFKSQCRGLVFGLPERSEDAQWLPNKKMFLATKESGYETRHMVRGLIHELGHAFEEKLGIEVTDRNSIYGNPPFFDNYAFTNPTEDFAETFMAFHLFPDELERTAVDKYADMKQRVATGM